MCGWERTAYVWVGVDFVRVVFGGLRTCGWELTAYVWVGVDGARLGGDGLRTCGWGWTAYEWVGMDCNMLWYSEYTFLVALFYVLNIMLPYIYINLK